MRSRPGRSCPRSSVELSRLRTSWRPGRFPGAPQATPGSARNQGVGLYDQSITFSVQASEKDVIAFFRAQLPVGRWKILGEGASISSASAESPSGAEAGYRILGQHPGSNGYEWELGVTVMPETFPPPRLSRGHVLCGWAAPVVLTPFTFRLFEVDDTS